MDETYNVIVIGAGPAGLTAALYISLTQLRLLVVEKETLGGQIMNIDIVENYPGFADGIPGPKLGAQMITQAMNHGVKFVLGEVQEVKLGRDCKIVKTSAGKFIGESIIIASGAHPKKLNIPGEAEFSGRGVFYCAVCDGGYFAGQTVAVVGGGDAGVTEALYLARLVSKAIIIESMPQLTASKFLQDKVLMNPKIEVCCRTQLEAIMGDDKVKAITMLNLKNGQKSAIEVDGVLVHVGIEPNTNYLKGIVPLDSEGQITVNNMMETEVPGVFAAGDVRSSSIKQITASTGDGAIAAIYAGRFLQEK
jgi:thioredoxin reductase (NADPH)